MVNSDFHDVAVRQIAHAVVNELLGTAEVVTISVVPSGRALGYISFDRPTDRIPSSEEIENTITVAMAGIASRDLIDAPSDSGEASNLQQACHLAEKLAEIESFGWRQSQPNLANTIVSRCHDRAKALVTRHKDRILKVADVLAREGTISGAQLAAL